MEPIKIDQLNNDLESYKEDSKNKVIRHALSKTALSDVAYSQDELANMDFQFDINIKTLPVADQKSSGRCWIFAATNLCREIIAKKNNLDSFELSQSYVAFYDRLEKSNYCLETIIELLGKDYDDRELSYILMNGISDGGQWDMFVSIIEKYGLCPKNVYPETYTSSNTRETNTLINFNIRKFASDAQKLYKTKGIDSVRKLKKAVLKKIYFLLVNTYGVPPTSFDFEYTDKNGNYHLEKGYTPLSFKEHYIGSHLLEYVSIINAPTKSKPFNKTYTIKYLGNVVAGKEIIHLNLPMKRMKQVILSQLKDDQIVWFGSDVAFYRDRASGAWDDTRYDYMSLTDMDYKMDKGESLDYRAAQMSHAMCITGVALKKGNPTKWKIENSWGSDNGVKGYYIMSSSWFDQYVFQAVVNKKYLSPEELKALEENPIVLKPWDPMGSLA